MRALDIQSRGRRRTLRIGGALMLALLWTAAAFAARPDAMAAVKATVNQALSILKNPAYKSAPEAKHAQIRKLLNEHFDFAHMARSSLGVNWRKLNRAQQKHFIQVFRRYLERHYVNIIEGYSGQKIEYVKETSLGPNESEVWTNVIQPQLATPLQTSYQLKWENGTWRAYDVTIAGISEIESYREEYRTIFDNQGFDALLKKLATAQ
jgi:phospholipid transport system substrate-binding protein